MASCLGRRRRAGASSRAFAPCEGAATKRKVEGSRPPQGRWRHSGAWGPLPQCRALAKGRKPRECQAPFFLRQRTIPARALVRQALALVEATVAPRTVPKPRDAALRMRERERGAAGSWPRRRRHGAHFALTRTQFSWGLGKKKQHISRTSALLPYVLLSTTLQVDAHLAHCSASRFCVWVRPMPPNPWTHLRSCHPINKSVS